MSRAAASSSRRGRPLNSKPGKLCASALRSSPASSRTLRRRTSPPPPPHLTAVSRRCWFQLEQLLDCLLEALEINRLRQVLGKTGFAGPVHVGLHSEAAQCNAAEAFRRLQLLH